jgi:hypothetical protein
MDLLDDDENDPARGASSRFDRWSGLAISVVQNQRLGDGGPEQRQLEPDSELARPNQEPPRSRVGLKGLGTVGATGVAAMVPADAIAEPQATPSPTAAAPTQSAEAAQAYIFLSPPEAAFIEAAVDRLIPADDLSPSGTDCGVATFIDRQLAGAWGRGDRLYMQGPWLKGTPTQGTLMARR